MRASLRISADRRGVVRKMGHTFPMLNRRTLWVALVAMPGPDVSEATLEAIRSSISD